MPGRKVSPVSKLFSYQKSNSFKGNRAICKFCFTEVADNGTRKEKHISECTKCTDEIKKKYLGNKLQKISANTSRTKKIKTSQSQLSIANAGRTTDISGPSTSTTAPALQSDTRLVDSDKSDAEDDDDIQMLSSRSIPSIAPIFAPNESQNKECGQQSSHSKLSNVSAAKPKQQLLPTAITRRPRSQQSKLEVDTMSQEQNVSVFNHKYKFIKQYLIFLKFVCFVYVYSTCHRDKHLQFSLVGNHKFFLFLL